MENERTGIIYKATSPSGKVYVGQTVCTLKYRVQKHKSDSGNIKAGGYDTKFYRAIRKYNISLFEWITLEENIKIADLDLKEREWIDKLNSFKLGYNSTLGGQKSRGSMTQDVKDKISRSKKGQAGWNKGVPMPKSVKEKISRSKKGQRKGISRPQHVILAMMKGKRLKEDNMNNKDRDEHGDKLSVAHGGVPFVVIDVRTKKEVGVWQNQSACARELSLRQSGIYMCLSGKQKSHKGYIFKRVVR